MNTLFSSGQTITFAVGNDYTLKDNEVMINGNLYRKIDVEIAMTENSSGSDQSDVLIGIKKRDGRKDLPAELTIYSDWTIDGVQQVDLSTCVDNINTAIQ